MNHLYFQTFYCVLSGTPRALEKEEECWKIFRRNSWLLKTITIWTNPTWEKQTTGNVLEKAVL